MLLLRGGQLVNAELFDCGENRNVTTDYLCDGDEDCFWGQDESKAMCSKMAEETSGLHYLIMGWNLPNRSVVLDSVRFDLFFCSVEKKMLRNLKKFVFYISSYKTYVHGIHILM